MKKRLLIGLWTILMYSIASGQQQKIVIGSSMPEIKNVNWLTRKPINAKTNIVKFIHPNDSCSIKEIQTLQGYKDRLGAIIEIIAISRVQNSAMDSLSKAHPTIVFGVDSSGDTFEMYDVKYVPETFILNQKHKVAWIGNLDTFDKNILEQIK